MKDKMDRERRTDKSWSKALLLRDEYQYGMANWFMGKVDVLNIFWIASPFHRPDDFSENIRLKNNIGFTQYFLQVLVLSSKMDQAKGGLIW